MDHLNPIMLGYYILTNDYLFISITIAKNNPWKIYINTLYI